MTMVRIACCHRIKKNLGDVIARLMPRVVARYLDEPNNPGFELISVDVGVRFEDSPDNILHHDIEVTVEANESPWRLENKDDLAGKMAKNLQKALPEGTTGFVWLRLALAGRASF